MLGDYFWLLKRNDYTKHKRKKRQKEIFCQYNIFIQHFIFFMSTWALSCQPVTVSTVSFDAGLLWTTEESSTPKVL